ncbi:threonine/serine exporter family protein [Lacticaseibacillus nasuensis]|uniref:threonine/serine exporter family protein n=1 Tax=Lacticaseibacillus nasuensis TaxID=944671 RepID=UPI0022471059|nr:threonine/serine exporter family protein [Lacticaseibacillus nasuensis]MCX2455049.1 threonine/serine exporter family protein [Lacticaseibacillus nasuensis]
MEILIQASFSYLATVAFAIIINVPRRNLNLAGWTGLIGWMTYWGLMVTVHPGRMLANLLGALAIGLAAMWFARWQKTPVILFTIPGLVPLVPGATAYQAVRALVLGERADAGMYFVRVVLVAGAIAVGFMLAQLVAELMYRTVWRAR